MCLARLSVVTTASASGRVRARGALTPRRGERCPGAAGGGRRRRAPGGPVPAERQLRRPVVSAREFVRHVLADWGSQADQDRAQRRRQPRRLRDGGQRPAARRRAGPAAAPLPRRTQRVPAAEPGEQVGLTLLATPSALLCVVNDPSSAAPVPRLPDPGTASGRGLHLIESLSESWGWSPAGEGDSAGKAVWAVFPLAGGGSPAARAGPATFRHTPGAWAFGSVVRRSERKGGSWGCAGVATPSNTARSSTR